ncbi:MAG TPA: hypothetical protein VGF94_13320 [Kofleriaceae bacterium]
MRSICAFAVVLAACGDNTHHTVQVDFGFQQPTLVEFRGDTTAWRVPEKVGASAFAFDVDDDYELVAVFEVPGLGVDSYELAATYADGDQWATTAVMSNTSYDPWPVGRALPVQTWLCLPLGTIGVPGTMLQAGRVALGGACQVGLSDPWSFRLDIGFGTYDLIASTPSQVLIERNVEVTANTIVPTIDASHGDTLVSQPVAVGNVDPTGSVQIDDELFTTGCSSDVASSYEPLATGTRYAVPIVPAVALQSSEQQWLDVKSTSNDLATRRVARVLLASATPVVYLPSPPVVSYGMQGEADVAIWSPPLAPSYDLVELDVSSELDALYPTSQHVTATKQWLDDHDIDHLAFDTDAPGFDPSWSIDRTIPYQRTFSVGQSSIDAAYMASATSIVQPR